MLIINRSSPIFKVVSLLIITLLLLIIGKVFIDNWSKIPFNDLKLNYVYILISLLFCLATSTLPAWLWRKIFHLLGENPRFVDIWRINNYALIVRYLPGKIWNYMGKIYWGQKLGLSKRKILVSTFLETVFYISSSFLVSLYSLNIFLPASSIYIVSLSVIILLIALHPRFLEKILNTLGRKWLPQPIVISFKYRDILLLLGLYTILSLVISLQCFVFLLSFYRIPYSHFPFFASINAASWLIGVLSVIAPGGLVVKEGVFVFGFKTVVPVSLAIVCAILLRIFTLVTEVLITMIFFILDKGAWKNLIEFRKSNPELRINNDDQ